jgi:hypothetical protein
VATVGRINRRAKGNFRVSFMLSKNPVSVRAFGKLGGIGLFLVTLPRRGFRIDRITSRRLFSIFHAFRVRGRGFFNLSLSAPSGGPLFAAVLRFRGWGSLGITFTLHGSKGLLISFLIDLTKGGVVQRDFLITDSQPPTAEDHF